MALVDVHPDDAPPDRCRCLYSQSTRQTTAHPFGRLVRVQPNPCCPEHSSTETEFRSIYD
jgi:hypothetical protein